MVLFAKISFFSIKTKSPMHWLEKVEFFPPLTHWGHKCVERERRRDRNGDGDGPRGGWSHGEGGTLSCQGLPKKIRVIRGLTKSGFIWFYCDYTIVDPTSVNDGVDCRLSSVRLKPWFYLQKSDFFSIKSQSPMHWPEKLGFFHPWHIEVISV